MNSKKDASYKSLMDESKLLSIKNWLILDINSYSDYEMMRYKNQLSKINILYFHIEKHANFD